MTETIVSNSIPSWCTKLCEVISVADITTGLFTTTFSLQRSLVCSMKFSLWNKTYWTQLLTTVCLVCFIACQHAQPGGRNCLASSHTSIQSLYSYSKQESVFCQFVIYFHGDKVKISVKISPPEGSNNCLWNICFSWYHCVSAYRRHLFPDHSTLPILMNYSILSRNFCINIKCIHGNHNNRMSPKRCNIQEYVNW